MTIDADGLARRSARLSLDGIDFGSFVDRSLDPASLRCLRYMHDVEHHTTCYLRDVLVTRAHQDPEVTGFLSGWAFEEHWHGDALARVLEAHGEPAGRSRVAQVRARLPRRDGLRPLLFSAGSALTRHMVAIMMSWGAVNELTTQAGYGRLAARSEHPVLAELLRRIIREEGRHIDFYLTQARHRLAETRDGQRLARFALRRFWGPVGSSLMPPAEVTFVATHLFEGPDGLRSAQRVDRAVDRIPGLGGLHLLEGAVRSGPATPATRERASTGTTGCPSP